MTKDDLLGCFTVIILFLLVVALAIVLATNKIETIKTCVSGGYAEAVSFNSTIVCVGIRDGAYTIEGLESVRLRLGLERGK